MNSKMTMANDSFTFLGQSSEFLNTIIHNIKSCVLLLDKDVKLRAYNDSLKTIFTKNKDKHLQFSTRLFPFGKEKDIIMIIEDITKWFEPNSQT
jgi:transcriptional regulator with PAS, ATPase and Fis domain